MERMLTMRCYIGFDLGGSSMKTGIVTEDAQVITHEKYPIPDSFEKLMQLLAERIQAAQKSHGILGAAISSAGYIDPKDGTVNGWMAPSLLYLKGRNFYELRRYTDLPVRAEKDGVAAALGEYWAGDAKGCENFLTLVLGTGQGGAVFINGKPYRGTHFFAGDMGYVSPGVGMRGFSQLTAPVPYEARYYRETGRRLSCSGMYEAREQDPVAARLWKEFLQNLACFCIQMQFTFDTEKIFIGGGISGWEPFIPLLREEIERQMNERRMDFNHPAVYACTGGNDANLLGAVYGLKTDYGI